jgi:uncharacterized metal-binding protein YceD (DUF177 family)
MTEPSIAPEFSRPVAVEQLHDREKEFVIEASEAERAALAERFGIIAIDALKAAIRLKPATGGMVRLAGHIEAQVRQACVVTLVEVPEAIDASFERVYSPAAQAEADEELEIDFESEDLPDPLIGGVIDIGEAAAEEVALALDPYPRAPGAVFERPAEGEPAPPTPFAALAKLKKEK